MNAQERWAVYFKYLTDKSKRDKINKIVELEEGIAMASTVLIKITKEEKERFRKLSKLKRELDAQNIRVTEKRRIEELMRKGREEGRKEGIQKGKLEYKREISALLKSGKSIEEILKD